MKCKGCLKAILVGTTATVLVCAFFLIITANSVKEQNVSRTTDIPETYEEALARTKDELSQNMTDMALLLQDPNASTLDTKLAIADVTATYWELSNLVPSPGQEQVHATTTIELLSCSQSARWFDEALSKTQGTAEYNHAIEQGYIFFNQCRNWLDF